MPPLAEVLDAIAEAETELARLSGTPAVPDQPDRVWADEWLHRSHLDYGTR